MSAAVNRKRGWESVLLAAMVYPANLAFAGLAAFLLAIPVVTWLAAAIAAGRAMHRWLADDDDRVFTNTFAEFRLVWRRTLPASLIATVYLVVLIVNIVFLGDQQSTVAWLFGMATLPVTAAFVLIVVLLPAAAGLDRDGTVRDWLRASVSTAAHRPLASIALVVLVIAFALTCVLLPTIAPFFGLSVPAWLGLTTTNRRLTHPRRNT